MAPQKNVDKLTKCSAREDGRVLRGAVCPPRRPVGVAAVALAPLSRERSLNRATASGRPDQHNI